MSMPDPSTLSSNWKLLSQRLKAGAPKLAPKPAATKESTISKKRSRSGADDKSTSKKPKTSKTSTFSKPTAPSKPVRKSRPIMTASSSTTASKTPASGAAGISASLALWAEDNDISPADLAQAYNLPLSSVEAVPIDTTVPSTNPTAEGIPEALYDPHKTDVGKYIAMDCEMVGIGQPPHEGSALARVSIVNFHGHCVLDCFVKPKEKVTDWRTWVSGVTPESMKDALTFEEAQKKVAELMEDRILVGHAIKNDLEALLIGHPKRDIRDTSRHPGFRKLAKGRTPGLKKLAKELLGIEIQGGEHSSVEDARACMLLYRKYKDEFEREHEKIWPSKTKTQRKAEKKKKKKN